MELKLSIKFILSVMLMIASTSLQAGESGHGHGHDSHFSKNFIGLFLGATRDTKSDTETTYGIEYERRFTKQMGAGLIYEKTPDAYNGYGIEIKLAMAFYHPHKGWRIGAGFGKEKVKDKTKNIKRLSVGYDFHVGSLGIGPSYAVDFVNGERLQVLGIVIGKPF